MKLYTMPGTCALAPHIALKWAGLPAEVEVMAHGANRSPEYSHINPNGKVPALVLDDGQVLTEAAAILPYVAELAPQARLDGDDPLGRGTVAEALSYMTSEVHANWQPHFAPQRFLDDEAAFPALKAKTYERLAANYRDLDRHMSGQDHLVLDRRTVADTYLYVLARWASLMPGGIEPYPELARFRATMDRDGGVREALRESERDAGHA